VSPSQRAFPPPTSSSEDEVRHRHRPSQQQVHDPKPFLSSSVVEAVKQSFLKAKSVNK